jgi:hypothetical protein
MRVIPNRHHANNLSDLVLSKPLNGICARNLALRDITQLKQQLYTI